MPTKLIELSYILGLLHSKIKLMNVFYRIRPQVTKDKDPLHQMQRRVPGLPVKTTVGIKILQAS